MNQSVQFHEGSKVAVAKPRSDVLALRGTIGTVVDTTVPGHRAWIRFEGSKLCCPFLPDELELAE